MATYNFTVRAEDETGAFSDRDFAIEVRNTVVEKFIAISSVHAFTSIDGINWTERSGQGGDLVMRTGEYWIITQKSHNSYYCLPEIKISKDGINWNTHYLPTGFNYTSAQSFVYVNGEYYFLTTKGGGNPTVLYKTVDFIKFDLVVDFKVAGFNSYSHPASNYGSPINMILDDDGKTLLHYTGYSNGGIANQGIIAFNTETKVPTLYRESLMNFPSVSTFVSHPYTNGYLMKVNGAYVMIGNPRSSSYRYQPMFSFDLLNWSVPNNAFVGAIHINDKKGLIYHNGNIIANYFGSVLYTCTDLQNYTKLTKSATTGYNTRDMDSYLGNLFFTCNIDGKVGTTIKYKAGDLLRTTVEDAAEDIYDIVLAGKDIQSLAVMK